MNAKITLASFLALIAFTGLLSISASADSPKFEFEVGGIVRHVGLSADPGSPTAVEAKLDVERRYSYEEVEIKTSNELVFGGIGGIGTCSGSGCQQLSAALSNSSFFSLHESVVKLEVTNRSHQWLKLQTASGQIPLFVQTLSGTLEGKLEGEVVIANKTGSIAGKTTLKIEGTGIYVCFSPYLKALGISQPLPGPLFPCQSGEGQLLPVELDVVDRGKIEAEGVTEATGEMIKFKAEIVVDVRAEVDLELLLAGNPAAFSTTGSLAITDGKGEID